MQLTKNFNLIEFACHDGTPVPPDLIPNVQLLANNLQVLRDEIGPLFILSGYRTLSHNKSVGGASNSYHVKAMAGDIISKTLTPVQLRTVIMRLIKEGKIKNGGLGSYKTFTHYDIGPTRRWKG